MKTSSIFLWCFLALVAILSVTVSSSGIEDDYDYEEPQVYTDYDDFEYQDDDEPTHTEEVVTAGVQSEDEKVIEQAVDEPLLEIPAHTFNEFNIEDYDQDEFEGFEELSNDAQVLASTPEAERFVRAQEEAASGQKADSKKVDPLANFPGVRRISELEFRIEGLFLIGAIVYLINVIIGRQRNARLASQWLAAVMPVLVKNFASAHLDGVTLQQMSSSTFELKVTGRENCVGAQITLNLIARQDLFSLILAKLLSWKDEVLIEVPMNQDSMDTFVFVLAKESKVKSLRSDWEDISAYTDLAPAHMLPKGFAVLTDCEDLVSHFTSNTEIRSALSKNQKFVESLHFTDQNTKSTNHKKMLRFVFSLPPASAEMKVHRTLLSMSFFLIDYVGKTQLKSSSRAKVDTRRRRAQKEVIKAREDEKREERLKAKEAKLRMMTPEERQKHEERARNRRLRKRVKMVR